jgi:hypothetical protein
MRIGWIGGVERYEVQLERLAKAAGHELEYHRGDVRGRGAQTLEGLVERCQLIVIVTETNSHGAVQLARKLCARVASPASRDCSKPSTRRRHKASSGPTARCATATKRPCSGPDAAIRT